MSLQPLRNKHNNICRLNNFSRITFKLQYFTRKFSAEIYLNGKENFFGTSVQRFLHENWQLFFVYAKFRRVRFQNQVKVSQTFCLFSKVKHYCTVARTLHF